MEPSSTLASAIESRVIALAVALCAAAPLVYGTTRYAIYSDRVRDSGDDHIPGLVFASIEFVWIGWAFLSFWLVALGIDRVLAGKRFVTNLVLRHAALLLALAVLFGALPIMAFIYAMIEAKPGWVIALAFLAYMGGVCVVGMCFKAVGGPVWHCCRRMNGEHTLV